MKSFPDFERLREASWRRKLTPAEEAQIESWLAADSGAQADWRAEVALTEALGRLSAAPVPSNFTARVLHDVERTRRRERSPHHSSWASFRWRVPWSARAAIVLLVLTGGLLTWQHDRTERRRVLAQSLVTVSELRTVANPEILENFDAIQAMGRTSADEDLLSLLQ